MRTLLASPCPLLLALLCVGACGEDGDEQQFPTPTIVSTSPTAGATDVAVTTTIEVTFSVAMNEGAGSVVIDPGEALVLTWSEGGTKVTARPPAPLEADTEYAVLLLNFESTASLPAGAGLITFTTAGPGG